MYQFPLSLSFKKVALAPQITVKDASGQVIFFVRQKMFKFKEEINVFGDVNQSDLQYTINADRVIDFSARYNFQDADGASLGSVKRQGRRSIFRARYDIERESNRALHIEEDNPAIKFADALLNEIPIVNLLTGLFFNPTYSIKRDDGTKVVSIKKKPSLFESEFVIDEVVDIDDAAEIDVILGIMMMVLLERARG